MTIQTDSMGPVFLVCRDGAFSDADWQRYLGELKAFMAGAQKLAGVLTVLRHYHRPNALQRAELTKVRLAEGAHKLVRHAYVVDSKEALATLSGLRWMGEAPFEEKTFDELSYAIAWLAEKCDIRDPLLLEARVHLNLATEARASRAL
jgi:hypothetical protein